MSNRPVMSRSWLYTINNPTEEDVSRLESLDCVVHVSGREVAPTTGTPHLQGYVRFKKPQRFSWWKNQFPTAHVEMRHGTEMEAWTYCAKDKDLAIEKGTPDPGRVYATRDEERDDIIKEIEDGDSYWEIRKRHKGFVFWNRRAVLDYMYDENRVRAKSTDRLPGIKADDQPVLL